MKEILIYTDGAAKGNPGAGGYGVLLVHGEHQKELSGSFDCTTNNRMELLAAITGLESLQEPCRVIVHSDSRYLVDAMTQGWLERWRAKGWMRTPKERVKNVDLWKRLTQAVSPHEIDWQWVRGHDGHEENERCDTLASEAALAENREVDEGFLAEQRLNQAQLDLF